jgi:cysteine desulfurase / selenocysteine lyase
MSGIDIERVRANFPILHQQVHGRPLAYLDNAASSQRPRAVLDAVRGYEEHDHANVHRGVHTLAERATTAYEAARATLAEHLATIPQQIVFTRGTTESLNLVAAAWGGANLGAGDRILVTELEHHSNIVPWQLIATRAGAEVIAVPVREDGHLDLEAFHDLLDERVKVLAVGHVSNALGVINPVTAMAAAAHAVGAIVVVDGAQAMPHLQVDPATLGADFYAGSGHKMYAPTGIGFLWGRAELLAALPPYQGGGEMIRTVAISGSTWAEPPHRFEAGTPNIAGAVGLAAAIDYLGELGLEAIAAHEHGLLDLATQELGSLPGVRLIGRDDPKVSVVSFVVDGVHPHDLGTILDTHGVATRAGHHCAMPLMQALGLPATTRASFSFYNTAAEISALVAGVRDAQRIFGVGDARSGGAG